MATEQPTGGEVGLSGEGIKRLENGVLYALAASSNKLQVPPGTRIWALYKRSLADLNIAGQTRDWMWDHIDYAVTFVKGAKKVARTSAAAKAVVTVLDLWTVVLAAQPGKPQPEEGPKKVGGGDA